MVAVLPLPPFFLFVPLRPTDMHTTPFTHSPSTSDRQPPLHHARHRRHPAEKDARQRHHRAHHRRMHMLHDMVSCLRWWCFARVCLKPLLPLLLMGKRVESDCKKIGGKKRQYTRGSRSNLSTRWTQSESPLLFALTFCCPAAAQQNMRTRDIAHGQHRRNSFRERKRRLPLFHALALKTHSRTHSLFGMGGVSARVDGCCCCFSLN